MCANIRRGRSVGCRHTNAVNLFAFERVRKRVGYLDGGRVGQHFGKDDRVAVDGAEQRRGSGVVNADAVGVNGVNARFGDGNVRCGRGSGNTAAKPCAKLARRLRGQHGQRG